MNLCSGHSSYVSSCGLIIDFEVAVVLFQFYKLGTEAERSAVTFPQLGGGRSRTQGQTQLAPASGLVSTPVRCSEFYLPYQEGVDSQVHGWLLLWTLDSRLKPLASSTNSVILL